MSEIKKSITLVNDDQYFHSLSSDIINTHFTKSLNTELSNFMNKLNDSASNFLAVICRFNKSFFQALNQSAHTQISVEWIYLQSIDFI